MSVEQAAELNEDDWLDDLAVEEINTTGIVVNIKLVSLSSKK